MSPPQAIAGFGREGPALAVHGEDFKEAAGPFETGGVAIWRERAKRAMRRIVRSSDIQVDAREADSSG
jgi:hypothetical protein